jgi:cytochrome d ubiquinol oxidase subunit I
LPASLAQPLSGDWAGRTVARTQPAKLAALEGHFRTEPYAPLRIGGFPDVDRGETRYAVEIPGGLSVLAHGDPAAPVTGLNDIPRDLWPPVAAVHVAFQLMVALGTWLALLSAWAAFAWWRNRLFDSTVLLRAIVWSTPLGFIAIEAGWAVTELGRQPWIVQGVMRTSEAVTPMPGLVVPFATFTLIYIGLAAVVIALIRRAVGETVPARSAG